MRTINLMKKLSILAAFFIVCSMEVSAFSDELTIYSGCVRTLQDPIDELTRKKLNIDVGSVCMSGGEWWARVQSEKPNIRADVFFGMSTSLAILGKREVLFLQYKSKAWENISKDFKDPDGFYYGAYAWADILCVNTRLMEQFGLKDPESWNDLLDPKWKGKIVWPNPATSDGAYFFIAGMVKLMGEDAAFDYLEKLDKNISQYTKSGGTPSIFVGRGEGIIALSNTSSLSAHIKEGYPLKPVAPKEGLPFATAVVGIFKSAKNVKDAKRLVDFMASEEAQTVFGTQGVIMARPEIKSSFWEPYIKSFPLIKDFGQEWAADNRERLLEKWKSKFTKR